MRQIYQWLKPSSRQMCSIAQVTAEDGKALAGSIMSRASPTYHGLLWASEDPLAERREHGHGNSKYSKHYD